MRFRIKSKKNKNKKNKISVIQKIKSMNYIRKQLKNIKSKQDALQRIAIFYEEYNKTQPFINDKLIKTEQLNHISEHKHILEFKNDLDSLKNMLDRIVYDINDKTVKQSVKQRILNTKTGTLALAFRLMGTMSMKYRNENCDIDNFKV